METTAETLERETIAPALYENRDTLTAEDGVEVTENRAYTTSVDRGLYYAYQAYRAAAQRYRCYAVAAGTGKVNTYPFGPSFMAYLAGGEEVSFDTIRNEIVYLLGAGSCVADEIGSGTDNRGNAYHFDFVDDAAIFFRMLTDKTRNEYWSQTNSFTDVAAEKWCNNAISTLFSMGIIDGYGDGAFRPDGPITRAAFTKMAVNFFDYHVKDYDGRFTDVEGDAWYAGYIQAAAELKLIEGFDDGTFRPDDYITRAQACAIINRTLGRVPDADRMSIRPLVTWPDCDEDAWYYADMMEATNSHDYQWITVGGEKTEKWTEKLPQRDWAALEHTWSTANSAKGGEVVG